MMAGFLAGIPFKTGVIRRSFGFGRVSVSAMARWLASWHVGFVHGLKIRVSAVRFCPWPLSRNHNSRVEIGAFGRAVAARIRFPHWRGNWRDSRESGIAGNPKRAERPLGSLGSTPTDAAYFLARVGLAYSAAMIAVLVFAAIAAGAR